MIKKIFFIFFLSQLHCLAQVEVYMNFEFGPYGPEYKIHGRTGHGSGHTLKMDLYNPGSPSEKIHQRVLFHRGSDALLVQEYLKNGKGQFIYQKDKLEHGVLQIEDAYVLDPVDGKISFRDLLPDLREIDRIKRLRLGEKPKKFMEYIKSWIDPDPISRPQRHINGSRKIKDEQETPASSQKPTGLEQR